MTRKELINQIVNEFALKRKRAELFATQNYENALKIKEYSDLNLKERQLILDISKAKFNKQNTKQLEQELKLVQQKKLQILKAKNINPNSLLPKYECNKCNDTGIIENNYCTCFNQALNNKLMQECNINLKDIPSLENYDLSIFNNDIKKHFETVLQFCKKFVNNFPTSNIKNIVFSGETGVGKSYLTTSLAKEIINKGYTTYYVKAIKLNNLMLKYHTTFTENKLLILDPVLNSDLLIIDDLGIEPILKNVTIEYLLLIINERLQNEKSTIINTNLSPQHIIDRYGERIFSRLMNKQNSLLISMNGNDLRLKKII